MKMPCLFRVMLVCVLGVSAPLAATADYYVARNGANDNTPPYTSWATAASNIQDAVNAATNAATVWVRAGTYTLPPNATNYLGSNVVYLTKSLTLRSESGDPADTIIDGESTNRGIAVNYTSFAGGFTLDGFTISNCFATNQGGGISVDASYPTLYVKNCVITDNRVGPGAKSLGGGLYAVRANPFTFNISNCVFRNNEALSVGSIYGEGGGAYLTASKPVGGGYIIDSLFEYNSAASGGGVQYRSGSSLGLNFVNCVIRYNTSSPNPNGSYGGGGVQFYYGWGTMRNCLIYKNYAVTSGAGIFNQKSGTVYLYNCTIVSNGLVNNPGFGSGIHVRPASTDTERIEMYNCIVRSNRLVDVKLSGTSVSYIAYSCLPTNQEYCVSGPCVFDSHILTNDPQFVDFAGDDFRLTTASPCLNTGSNDTSWMTGTLDLDGNPRIDRAYERVDMGCYEKPFVNGTSVTIR